MFEEVAIRRSLFLSILNVEREGSLDSERRARAHKNLKFGSDKRTLNAWVYLGWIWFIEVACFLNDEKNKINIAQNLR